jgi:hypothetical protein
MKETMKKKGRKIIITMINLILSHSNRTFLILDLQIEPQTLRHTPCTLRIYFFKCEEGSIIGSICFKLVLWLLVPEP